MADIGATEILYKFFLYGEILYKFFCTEFGWLELGLPNAEWCCIGCFRGSDKGEVGDGGRVGQGLLVVWRFGFSYA